MLSPGVHVPWVGVSVVVVVVGSAPDTSFIPGAKGAATNCRELQTVYLPEMVVAH